VSEGKVLQGGDALFLGLYSKIPGETKLQEFFYDVTDIFINCSWVVTQWQYTFTHKQYLEQHK